MKHFNSNSRIILIVLLLQFITCQGYTASVRDKGQHKHYLKIRSPQDLKAMFRYTGDSVCFHKFTPWRSGKPSLRKFHRYF